MITWVYPERLMFVISYTKKSEKIYAWSKTIVQFVRVSIAMRKHHDQRKIWRGSHLCHLKHP